VSAGGGKYGHVTTELMRQYKASGVPVCVAGGEGINGFSVAVTDPSLLATMAAALRTIADRIDRDAAAGELEAELL
jgi:hypothetical protein